MPSWLSSIPSSLLTLGLGMLSGVVGLVAVRLTRWKLDALSREELLKALEEYRQHDVDRDRQLAALRAEFTTAEQTLHDFAERLKREEGQSIYLLRQRLRRDRYIRQLQGQLRRAGLPVPPEPNNDEEEEP